MILIEKQTALSLWAYIEFKVKLKQVQPNNFKHQKFHSKISLS